MCVATQLLLAKPQFENYRPINESDIHPGLVLIVVALKNKSALSWNKRKELLVDDPAISRVGNVKLVNCRFKETRKKQCQTVLAAMIRNDINSRQLFLTPR